MISGGIMFLYVPEAAFKTGADEEGSSVYQIVLNYA